MLASSDTPSELLGAALSGSGVLIATAVARLVKKRGADKQAMPVRVTTLERDVKDLREGLFGKRSMFGKTDGFVDEVRGAFLRLAEAVEEIAKEVKPNGGKSLRDDLNAVRAVVAPREEAGNDPVEA